MTDLLSSSRRTVPVELYQAHLTHIPADISALLATYSGIAPEDQHQHIVQVRDRAYKAYPYPCLGRWRFLELDLASHPLYRSEILPAVSPRRDAAEDDESWIFLDLGTCLGQDVRKLLFDGADPGRLYGADLRPEFIEIGYALFRDQDRFPRDEHFIAPADLFDFSRESPLSRRCDGRVGILHISAVFHLFGWEDQVTVARRCLQLLSPREAQGVGTRKRRLVCGGQTANVNAGDYPRKNGGSRYRHNGESWKKLWELVAGDEEWKGRVQALEVSSVLEERNLQRPDEEPERDRNNVQRQIGRVEEGFRWMKWWVWVEFV